jgi:hypothetical protein
MAHLLAASQRPDWAAADVRDTPKLEPFALSTHLAKLSCLDVLQERLNHWLNSLQPGMER